MSDYSKAVFLPEHYRKFFKNVLGKTLLKVFLGPFGNKIDTFLLFFYNVAQSVMDLHDQ